MDQSGMSVFERLTAKETSLAVIGLGYVGMPLAIAFAHKVKVIGFDANTDKILAYKKGIDYTLEVGADALCQTTAEFTSNEADLRLASFIIVAVPTPINADNLPDLTCIRSACEVVGRNLSRGAVVVFESTVYSGITEHLCVPIIEQESGLICGNDFKIGYSPERINPGDNIHRLDNIKKIVAGMDDETTEEMSKVYGLVVTAGTFKAKSIQVAELAKLEENAQRDINIAFMNEVAKLHDKLGIDTIDVIKAMNTKWNALNFYPGLVGGHCISVDPYYLIYRAEQETCHSPLMQAGRIINNGMAAHVADAAIKQMIQADLPIKQAKVYIFGITYKENCPDIRNSKVIDIIRRLNEYSVQPRVVDMMADKGEVKSAFNVDLVPMEEVKDADCIIFAVAHDHFSQMSVADIANCFAHRAGYKKLIVDIKNIFNRDAIEESGYIYWCL